MRASWGWWIGSALAAGLLLGLAALLVLPRLAARPPALATPTVWVAVVPRPSATPTPTATPAPDAGFAVGRFVQVADTGGVGLRFRAEPGLSGKVLFLGLDSEVFRIEDGPAEADGYVWWYLVAPYDPTRAGWAAQDFLQPIETP